MMAPGTSSMLRARRRDVNVKPNRRLDRKSSRGMLYENEELRLRTININAEVERGQNDIKKLRRENEQLRREIWGLREEYDRLEGLLGKARRRGAHQGDESDNGEKCEDEDEEYDEEEDEDDDDENGNAGEHSADIDNAENQQKASSSSRPPGTALRVEFDGLSIVDEETDEEGDNGGRGEQQFLGKIKLPSGKEGVFLSDAALPNGLPLYNAAAAATAYDFGSVMGFGPSDYRAAWPDVPALLPSVGQSVMVFPSSQSHYNYTFTPVDAEHDGYFGMSDDCYQRRGGPDLFISGAYPATRSPGVNLDQLLRQMNEAAAAEAAREGKDDRESGIVQQRHTCTARRPDSEPTERGGPTCKHGSLPPLRNDTQLNKSSRRFSAASIVRQQSLISEAQRLLSDFYGVSVVRRDSIVSKYLNDISQVGDGECCNRGAGRRLLSSRRQSSILATLQRKDGRPGGVRPHTLVLVLRTGLTNLTSQEVIDALETQLGSRLDSAVRGVRVEGSNCYVCLSKDEDADALLETGLTLRGERIPMQDAHSDAVVVSLSGVPHDVPDSSVAAAIAEYGTIVGSVERNLYKGVDTGQRLVRLKPANANIGNMPPTINIAGSNVTVRTLKPPDVTVPSNTGISGATDANQTATAPITQRQIADNPSKFLDSTFSADRFRSQLNVRLKQPNLKPNRSLDNIFDSASDRKQHNTSLPIIDTSDTNETKFSPLKISSDDKSASENLASSEDLDIEPPQKAISFAETSPKQVEEVKPEFSEANSNKVQEPTNSSLPKENICLKIGNVMDNQASSEIQGNYTPNIFSKLPNRKSKCHNAQLISTTDDSTDSVDVHSGPSPHVQSNPFVGTFPTSSGNLQFPSYPTRPVSPAPVNPFVTNISNHPNQYQDICSLPEHTIPPYATNYQPDAAIPITPEYQQKTNNTRVCSPYPHMNTSSALSARPGNIAVIDAGTAPITATSSQMPVFANSPLNVSFRQPTNSDFFHDPKAVAPHSNTNFPGSGGQLPNDVSSSTLQLPVATSSGNLQYFKMPAERLDTFPTQTAPLQHSGARATSPLNTSSHDDVTDNTLEVPRPQPPSGPSSPLPARKHTTQQKPIRKSSILSRQQSKSSGDEGPNLSPPTSHKHVGTNPTPASPASRRKISRRVSCTNSTGSLHNAEEAPTGSLGWPTATSSPNTKHRTSVAYHRKTSTGVPAAAGADAPGSGHTNAIDVSRSSSSGAAKRRDSVFVANGGSGGIIARSLSLDHSHRYGGSTTDVATGHCAGAETTTTTCSERERTNSASSRTSSATGGLGVRKHSECSNRAGSASASDIGKVPWCGCWGNGCI
ncbi:mucin-4-like isoform X2 [Periplaneta americana]|uniref:mucin-4-like isoform X2 n=1 Tax=Periplaneta americana TaxID=6978 RepID=UPI0037E80D1F